MFIWVHWVLAAACELLGVACGIQFPNRGSNLGPLRWEQSLSHWSTKKSCLSLLKIGASCQLLASQVLHPHFALLCNVNT